MNFFYFPFPPERDPESVLCFRDTFRMKKASPPRGEEAFAGSMAGYSASDHSITTGKWSEGYFRL